MAIPGVDYKVLISAAQRAKDAELVTVLKAAQQGQVQGFENNPDLVARAHFHLARDKFFKDHPSRAETLKILRPTATLSAPWPYRTMEALSSQITKGWREKGWLTIPDKVRLLYEPVVQRLKAAVESEGMRRILEETLATKLGRRPSDDEIWFHLTDKGERSLLPEIAKDLKMTPEQLKQIAEGLVKEGVLRPTQKGDIERARKAKEGKGARPRGR